MSHTGTNHRDRDPLLPPRGHTELRYYSVSDATLIPEEKESRGACLAESSEDEEQLHIWMFICLL